MQTKRIVFYTIKATLESSSNKANQTCLASGNLIEMKEREFYSCLIRLNILYHAVREPIIGLGITEELARHGYKLSPGTLYPMLHDMERKGYLSSAEEKLGRHIRRVYQATSFDNTLYLEN